MTLKVSTTQTPQKVGGGGGGVTSYYDVETTVSPVTTDNDAVISITNEVFVITKYLYPAEEGKFGSTARALSHNEATADPAVSTRGVLPNVSPETLVSYSVLKKAVLLLCQY